MWLPAALGLLMILIAGCGAPQLSSSSSSALTAPASVDFGNVVVGQSSTSQVKVSNSGSTSMTISTIKVAGKDFSLSGQTSLPLTLQPSQSTSIGVAFSPTSTGTASGTLTLTSDSKQGGSKAVHLTGTGHSKNSGSLSSLSCANSSITGAGTDNCTVTLSVAADHPGLSVALTSSNSAITVPSSITVAAGATTASFTATASAVTTTQSVTLTANDGSVTKTFSIQLNPGSTSSVAPAALSALTCSSTSLTGAVTDACSVSLTGAAGSGGLAVMLASSSSAVSVPGSVTVPAGATSASFTATASTVSTSQTVTLTASAGGVSKTLSLQLTAATAQIAVSPTTLAFGNVTVGSPTTQSVTIVSNGSAALTINSATISGTGFSLGAASFPITLNPGQSASLQVKFNPTSATDYTGNLTINSNASSGATTTVSLSGTGVATSYSVALTWSAPSSSTDPVTGYDVYRALSGSTSYQLLNSTPTSSTTYTDSSVTSGQSYLYYVVSVDSSGNQSSPSNTYSVNIP